MTLYHTCIMHFLITDLCIINCTAYTLADPTRQGPTIMMYMYMYVCMMGVCSLLWVIVKARFAHGLDAASSYNQSSIGNCLSHKHYRSSLSITQHWLTIRVTPFHDNFYHVSNWVFQHRLRVGWIYGQIQMGVIYIASHWKKRQLMGL